MTLPRGSARRACAESSDAVAKTSIRPNAPHEIDLRLCCIMTTHLRRGVLYPSIFLQVPYPLCCRGSRNCFLVPMMSRAFVNEDAGQWGNPARRFDLPDRADPGFDKAAASAMLEAAREGDTGSAEMATGYYWGEEKLKP